MRTDIEVLFEGTTIGKLVRLPLLVCCSVVTLVLGVHKLVQHAGYPSRARCVNSSTHTALGLLNVTVVACCVASNSYIAFVSVVKLDFIICAGLWACVLGLHISYVCLSQKRSVLHATANLLVLYLFLLDTTLVYVYPAASTGSGSSHTSFPRFLVHRVSFISAVLSGAIPLITPAHNEIEKQGSNVHPRDLSSPLTRWWTYGWATPFIISSYRGEGRLSPDCLPPLSCEGDPRECSQAFFLARNAAKSTRKALWSLFAPRFLFMAGFMVLCGMSELLAAIGLRDFLKSLEGSEAFFQTWASVLLFSVSPMIRGLFMQAFEYTSTQSIGRLKAIVIYTVYDKIITSAHGRRLDAGEVTNYVTADIDKISTIRYTIMATFLVPVEVAMASVLLYTTVGWSYLPGLLIIVVTRLPISWYTSKYQGFWQSRVMSAIDERVRRVGEVIQGLQTIKMLGQAPAFTAWIKERREAELLYLWHKFTVVTAGEAISSSFVLMPMIVTLGTYMLVQGKTLTPAVVFTVMSVFNTLKQMLSLGMIGVGTYAQSMVSLQRLVSFLDDEFGFSNGNEVGNQIASSVSIIPGGDFFGARNISIDVSDGHDSVRSLLSGCTFNLVRGGLNVITGNTGSGKSTLLNAILGEHPVREGEVNIGRRVQAVSYAGQSPWLQKGTIRDNILFGSPYSTKRYSQVICALALDVDMDNMPKGDQTDVGEAGSALSGVALARAVYADTAVVILDDVLAALDTTTAGWIVDNCILGPLLSDRTLIFVTEHVKCRERADLVIEINGSQVTTSRPQENHLIDLGKPSDVAVSKTNIQPADSSLSEEPSSTASPYSRPIGVGVPTQFPAHPVEVILKGRIGRLYILKYLKVFGSRHFLIFFCPVILAAHTSDIASSFWLTLWSGRESHESQVSKFSTEFYLLTYAGLGVSQILLVSIASMIFFYGAIRASRTQHAQMVASALGATFAWITHTPAGQIMNRFSADICAMDNTVTELLKQVIENYLGIIFRLVAVTTIIPTFCLPAVFLLGLGLYTGHVYSYGSTASKRFYSAAVSPLLSDISDTISGIEVIRAHRAQWGLQARFMQSLERYIRAWETVSACQRWLAVRMDLFVGFISFSTAILALRSNDVSPASVGFSLTSATSLCTALLYVVYLSSLLEVELSSFQRLDEYIHDTPQEPLVLAGSRHSQDLECWPKQGHVRLSSFTAAYALDGQPVLSDINLDVAPGQRLAIVGRSGSGKSSLVSGILRLLTRCHGTVTIDGIDIDTVSVQHLREKICFVPQKPVLFEGSLRFNLDFSSTISDKVLHNILHEVFGSDSNRWNLDRHIATGGTNLSQGERQLVALARVLVTNASIIIIDEGTTNLGECTESRVQWLLQKKFVGKTVIAIAHRLASILDFEEVVVMDQGRIIERGQPRKLIDARNSNFSKLWNALHESGT